MLGEINNLGKGREKNITMESKCVWQIPKCWKKEDIKCIKATSYHWGHFKEYGIQQMRD